MEGTDTIDLRTITCRPEGLEEFDFRAIDTMIDRVEKLFADNSDYIVTANTSPILFEFKGKLVGLKRSEKRALSAAKCLSLLQGAKQAFKEEQMIECCRFMIGAAQEFVYLEVIHSFRLFDYHEAYQAQQLARSEGGRSSRKLTDEQWEIVMAKMEVLVGKDFSAAQASREIYRQIVQGEFKSEVA